MYNYNRIYKLGYLEGTKKAIEENESNKKFKNINKKEIISKLYDMGYMDGYNAYYKYMKINSLKYK